jgi:hypothetical protein
MIRLLGVDFETMHDDAKTTPITEIGAILVEIEGKKWRELDRYSTLVYHPGYPPQTEKIVALTSITDEMLKADGIEPRAALPPLFPLMEQADYIIAHNISFDKTVLESVCARLKLTYPVRPWICSYRDVLYPEKFTCKKLSHLAFEHGMQVDISKLHRATDDVQLMLQFLTTFYSMEEIIEYWKLPWVFVKASVPKPWLDGGAGKEQAKKLGFGWQTARGMDEPFFKESWIKRIKARDLEKEMASSPLKLTVMEGFNA